LSEIIREIDNCWSAGCPSPPVGRDGNKRGGRRWWVGFYIFFLVAASFRKAQETIIHKVLFQDVKKP
jgi:hypothetical protein